VVTDLGLLQPEADTCELVMTHVHPGVTIEQCRKATGWPLQEAPELGITDPVSAGELAALRELQRGPVASVAP
jgi:acyl CoA:acetate/3-ketoacid CoA transferase beta subunit